MQAEAHTATAISKQQQEEEQQEEEEEHKEEEEQEDQEEQVEEEHVNPEIDVNSVFGHSSEEEDPLST